jgi:hypothetical protein
MTLILQIITNKTSETYVPLKTHLTLLDDLIS